jgi:hypothetical protein
MTPLLPFLARIRLEIKFYPDEEATVGRFFELESPGCWVRRFDAADRVWEGFVQDEGYFFEPGR